MTAKEVSPARALDILETMGEVYRNLPNPEDLPESFFEWEQKDDKAENSAVFSRLPSKENV